MIQISMRRFLEISAVVVVGAIIVELVEFFMGVTFSSSLGRVFYPMSLMFYGIIILLVGQRHNEERKEERKRKNLNLWG
ncbi:TPA: hypothetical protein DCW61_01375 [Candidatus Uhrbacteria bacterium]|nr:hypothetical protein [Candidatus Uhrbacteria bacterium]